MNTLELRNITYNDVFNDISIFVKKGHNISIVASSDQGKSALNNILAYKLNFKGIYEINGVEISLTNKYLIDRYISVIDNNYKKSKIIDILFDYFDDLDDDLKEMEINKILKYFSILKYAKYKIDDLNNNMKYYILIILKLLTKDTYLVIDDYLCYLNNNQVKKVYTYAKKNKVTIINITSNLDNIFNSEYAYFIYNKKIAMEGDILSCLKEERLIKRLGFKLPFMFDLSLQLNYYEVLDNIYLDKDKMIDKIWN